MDNERNIIKIIKIVGTVIGGTILATLTLLIIYLFFWILKIISTGIISVADFVIGFILANWASGLGIIAMLIVGMIELELLVVPKLSFLRKAKKNETEDEEENNTEDESDEKVDDTDEVTDEALNYLFGSDLEEKN